MTFWILNACLVFALSALFAGIVIPQILLISQRKQLYDGIDGRKIHKGKVSRLGGIAFKPVIFFTLSLFLALLHSFGYSDLLGDLSFELHTFAFSFCTIMMLYLIGIADDLIGVRYTVKFIVQILCGVMMVLAGLYFSDLHGFFFIDRLTPWIGYPTTVLVVVYIINAINLIDGIDGLASGLSGVAVIFYGIMMLATHQWVYAMLAFATLGVLAPFFYYNVYGDATRFRKIFMGDTGSTTIGMILSILALKLFDRGAVGSIFGPYNTFALAFSPLIIPCFDVVRVYFHRLCRRQNPFLPDKNHIHHKLLALGLPQRVAMPSIVLASVVLTLMNILLSASIDITLLLFIDIAVYALINVWLTVIVSKKQK